MSVRHNLIQLKQQLPQQVTLVAVSKTKPLEMLLEAYEAGQRDFGENYVQELVAKQPQLPADIRWHFIGHLQSNKVKYIAPFVYLVHGVDSLKLLREINKEALKHNRVIGCLLQVYIATEETKFGLSFEECRSLLVSEELQKLGNIRIRGFMGMASNTASEAQVKEEFSALKRFFDEERTKHAGLEILSCGMSGDYLLAIACGSNMIRLGSSIFGQRDYPAK